MKGHDSTWTQKDVDAWKRLRAGGLLLFTIKKGILTWGVLMSVFLLVLHAFSFLYLSDGGLESDAVERALRTAICSGLGFGIGMSLWVWHRNERELRKRDTVP
jgi:hypothetical protein